MTFSLIDAISTLKGGQRRRKGKRRIVKVFEENHSIFLPADYLLNDSLDNRAKTIHTTVDAIMNGNDISATKYFFLRKRIEIQINREKGKGKESIAYLFYPGVKIVKKAADITIAVPEYPHMRRPTWYCYRTKTPAIDATTIRSSGIITDHQTTLLVTGSVGDNMLQYEVISLSKIGSNSTVQLYQKGFKGKKIDLEETLRKNGYKFHTRKFKEFYEPLLYDIKLGYGRLLSTLKKLKKDSQKDDKIEDKEEEYEGKGGGGKGFKDTRKRKNSGGLNDNEPAQKKQKVE